MYQNRVSQQDNICILAYADSNHYLLAVAHGTEKELIHDDQQRPLSFESQYQAQEWLKHLGIHRAQLVMVSAYDEMIGHDQSVSECQTECRF